MRYGVLLAAALAMVAGILGFSMAVDESQTCCPLQTLACLSQGCSAAGTEPAAASGCSAAGCPSEAACCSEAPGSADKACSPDKACSAEQGCSAEKACPAKKPALVCPVSGEPASKANFVAFNGGKVYFRCGGCKAEFEKHPNKYATKANLQLVKSGQAVQKGCPFTGGKTDRATELSVSGVKVAFCGSGCQKKVAKAKPDEQLKLVFGEKAFPKAFEIKKPPKKKEPAKNIEKEEEKQKT